MKAWELLDKPEKWIQHHVAETAEGIQVDSWHPDAVRWCLSGAIARCYADGSLAWDVEIAVKHEQLKPRIGNPQWLSGWNDDPARTYEEVHTLLKELDI